MEKQCIYRDGPNLKLLGLLKFAPRILGATKDLRTKGWYTSRTILTNIIVLAADIAQALGYIPGLELGEAESIAVAVVAISNIYLRLVTTTPIGTRTEREITDDAQTSDTAGGAAHNELQFPPVKLPPIELQARPEPGTGPASAADSGFQNR
jgi:hypothetical protein